MNKRDLFLQEMGITQWVLTKPQVLKGVVQVLLSEKTRLVIVSDEKINESAVIFQDILRTLQLNAEEYLCLNFEQVQHLQHPQPVSYWLLSQNEEKIHRTLAQLHQATLTWQSASWAELTQSAQAKRQLWQQMQPFFAQGNLE